MHTNPDRTPDDGGPDVGSPLPVMQDLGDQHELLLRRLLDVTCHALAWGGVPAAAGLDVVSYLTREAGLPVGLAGRLVAVAERLCAIPDVGEVFRDGVISFDQLAGFVRATRRCNGEPLARLDAEAASLAGALAAEHRIHAWVGEVDQLVDDLRAPGWAERQERRAELGNRVIVAQDFDGGGFLHAELDKLGMTVAVTALDAAAPTGETSRRRARATGLLAICEASLAGTTVDGVGRPARPTVVLHVDLADATVDRFARLLRVANGGRELPTLSARGTDTIARHADLLLQIRDGHRPLVQLAGETDGIPVAVRRAVLARDRGCRGPDCSVPAALTHLHHIVPRSAGGSHDPDNLLALGAFDHLRRVHRHSWHPDLDPTSGRVTWTRPGNRPIATMPHGHRPSPVRDPALLADWLAPPRSPPPDAFEPPGPDLPPPSWTVRPDDLHTAA